jgi:hypothetical protein
MPAAGVAQAYLQCAIAGIGHGDEPVAAQSVLKHRSRGIDYISRGQRICAVLGIGPQPCETRLRQRTGLLGEWLKVTTFRAPWIAGAYSVIVAICS